MDNNAIFIAILGGGAYCFPVPNICHNTAYYPPLQLSSCLGSTAKKVRKLDSSHDQDGANKLYMNKHCGVVAFCL